MKRARTISKRQKIAKEDVELSFEEFLKENKHFSEEMKKLAVYETEIHSHKLIEGPEVDHLYL